MKSGKVTLCRLITSREALKYLQEWAKAVETDSKIRGSSMFVKMESGNKEFLDLMQEKGMPHHVVIIHGDLSMWKLRFSAK